MLRRTRKLGERGEGTGAGGQNEKESVRPTGSGCSWQKPRNPRISLQGGAALIPKPK